MAINPSALLDVGNMVGVVACAMTAALIAGKRRLDWVGVAVLGSTTALGGGSARDVLLGHYPLAWVAQPWLLLLATAAALSTIALARVVRRLPITFLVLDAIGLVVFTVIGCSVAQAQGHGVIIAMVSGVISGCVGGVLRDVLIGEVPLLLRREVYATVSLLTGGLYVGGLALGLAHDPVMLVAMAVGLVFRIVAVHRQWNVPTFDVRDDDQRDRVR
jgi:uncharacterized membrane protein YeiH